MATKTIFETETCSRCGGSGRYSYCQMYGDTCFKCAGRTKVYTKRGQAAKMYYEALCSLPLESLTVGMEIWNDACPLGTRRGGWAKILEIRPDKLNAGMTIVETDGISHGTYAGSKFRVRQNPEQVAAKQSLAIILQRSLNKAGKLDKALAKLSAQIAWA